MRTIDRDIGNLGDDLALWVRHMPNDAEVDDALLQERERLVQLGLSFAEVNAVLAVARDALQEQVAAMELRH